MLYMVLQYMLCYYIYSDEHMTLIRAIYAVCTGALLIEVVLHAQHPRSASRIEILVDLLKSCFSA